MANRSLSLLAPLVFSYRLFPASLIKNMAVRGYAIRYDLVLKYYDYAEKAEPKEMVEKSEGAYQIEKGKVYSKRPFKYTIEKGKKYSWCSCGYSHSQPFCDGEHKKPWVPSGLKPVKFIASETKEVWFCNCKQTNTKPYCDKSCDIPAIQEMKL